MLGGAITAWQIRRRKFECIKGERRKKNAYRTVLPLARVKEAGNTGGGVKGTGQGSF